MKVSEDLRISAFSGLPWPGDFHDFDGSPAPAGAILSQITAQLRKANILPRGCQARGTLLLLAAQQKANTRGPEGAGGRIEIGL